VAGGPGGGGGRARRWPVQLNAGGGFGSDAAAHRGPADRAGARAVPDVLAGPRLAPLWTAAHRRLEETGGETAGVAVHLRNLSDEEKAAVDRLLGVRSRGRTVRVDLARLDALMRQRAGTGLAATVSALVGPLQDRPGARAATREADRQRWEAIVGHPAIRRHPDLQGWLEGLRRRGTWRDDALHDALAVLERLPQTVRRGRSNLAARVLGDAHALDDNRPAGRLVVSALAALAGISPPLRAADRRQLWAQQGVVPDETSSTVLTLGLRPVPAGPLTEAAARWASASVPLPIPLAALTAERWRVADGTPVWVCENPSVLAAATGTAASVVCIEGRPSVAAQLLLTALAEGGASLRYHGDFGGGGLSIANTVIGTLGARPWRFGTADHAVALERARSSGVPLRPLRGPVPDARWDEALAPAVRSSGVEVEEESVIDLLLSDLTGARPG
jgi:uncharacterized protein (TIGR02679 family)